MNEIKTERLLLRAFKESDYDDLFEYLSQLENNEFEGYPGITYENDNPIWKDTYVYAATEGDEICAGGH